MYTSTIHRSTVIAKMEMEAGFVNLAAELLPSTLSEQLAGSHVRLQFYLGRC